MRPRLHLQSSAFCTFTTIVISTITTIIIMSSSLFLLPAAARTCTAFAISRPPLLLRRSLSSSSSFITLSPPSAIRRKLSRTHMLPRTRLFSSSSSSSSITQTYDDEQERLMDTENIIAVTFDDKPLKPVSKRQGHKASTAILHRAFSIFLFDTQGRMLLQKRASGKITFPDTWTNTCCSHPLWYPYEMGEDSSPTDPALGCKRAAIRKLEHELGIPSASLSVEDFVYMTRIHYLADSAPDPAWGEHEVDYVFVVQKDIEMKLNPNEVSEVVYVTKEELKAMMRKAELHRGESQAVLLAEEDEEEKQERKKKGNNVKIGPPPPPSPQTETKGEITSGNETGTVSVKVKGPLHFTPWSRVIIERWLFSWWADIGPTGNLEKHFDRSKIHRIGRVDP